MKFDLHLHTGRHSHDSQMDPLDLVRRAVEIGLDGIVITEHGYQWPEWELEELRAAAPGLVVLSGIEVTGRGGDVLVYGLSDPSAVPRGIDWPDLCAEVRRQGAAAVVAHPFRWDQPIEELLAQPGVVFDGLEVMSNNMDPDLRAKAADLARRRPEFVTLGNSDGHTVGPVGCCVTEFEVPVRTATELVAAIKGRRCVARDRA